MFADRLTFFGRELDAVNYALNGCDENSRAYEDERVWLGNCRD
jgi:hypothetical protein